MSYSVARPQRVIALLLLVAAAACVGAAEAPRPSPAGQDPPRDARPAPAPDGGGPAPDLAPGMGPVPPERPAPGAPDAAGRGQTPTPPPSAASDELYDPEKVPRFDIELPAASVTALGRDPRQYVTGTFRYGNETISNVGIRLKGEATLRPLTRKAPFKIKFDEFVPDQRFRGLARMTLNNVTEDATFIAERLAYHAFRAAKLPAPRASSALVFVNGQPYGLYANVETEDKTFLARWFASNDGNLYEEGQKDFLPGNEATFELETNETRNDRSDLGAFIAALGTARPASFLADLSATLDTAHFLKFTAVEALVNQWDMYAYTRFYPNNFRLYADPTTRKLVFLPWGMDMSLKDFRGNGDHIGVFTVGRENNAANGRITGGVVFQRCLTSPSCKATYSQTLREMLAAFEALRLDELAERYHAQVRPHVMADPRKEVTVAEFERMHQTMVRIIRERPARVRAELGNN